METPRSTRWIWLIVLAHLILASIFASITPYRTAGVVKLNGPSRVEKDIGAPDERQHANYIARLARGEGFPVFNPQDPNLYETYQAHQPPLYYVIAAGVAKLTGQSDADSDSFRILRFLNVLLGGLTVFGVYRLAQNAGAKEISALTAACFAAFLPMHAALSGAISNDPLLFCCCTWALALVLPEEFDVKRLATVGALIGLACLTKTTALALFPVIGVVAIQRRDLRFALFGIAIPVLIAGAWWARNQSLYGDPFALKAFSDAFGGSAQKATFVEQIIPRQSPEGNPELIYWTEWVAWWTARSFYGVFGYMDIWLTQSGLPSPGFEENRLYVILLLVGAIGLLAGVSSSLRNGESRKFQIPLVVFGLVVLVLFLRFNNQYFQSQARYLYPAIGPISVWVGYGYGELLKAREKFTTLCVVIPLLIANLVAISRLPGEFGRVIEAGKQVQSSESVTP